MKDVFLVDDDEIFNLLNARAIKETGIDANIHVATNGQSAITLVNEYFQGTRMLPDIILVDINMPIMDGFSFIEAFQHLTLPGTENVKIVILSSSLNPSDHERANKLGVKKFLIKPVSESDLMAVLC